jgi:hypothetical protein
MPGNDIPINTMLNLLDENGLPVSRFLFYGGILFFTAALRQTGQQCSFTGQKGVK